MNENIYTLLSAEGEEIDASDTISEEITSDETSEETDTKNDNNILTSLGIMGKGMLGIFLVTLVIILSIVLLNKFTSPKKPRPSEGSDNA